MSCVVLNAASYAFVRFTPVLGKLNRISWIGICYRLGVKICAKISSISKSFSRLKISLKIQSYLRECHPPQATASALSRDVCVQIDEKWKPTSLVKLREQASRFRDASIDCDPRAIDTIKKVNAPLILACPPPLPRVH